MSMVRGSGFQAVSKPDQNHGFKYSTLCFNSSFTQLMSLVLLPEWEIYYSEFKQQNLNTLPQLEYFLSGNVG